jgi:hypothetical protein
MKYLKKFNESDDKFTSRLDGGEMSKSDFEKRGDFNENFKKDFKLMSMCYDDFVKWREDGYISYLINFSKDNIDSTDHNVLVKFNNGYYDSYDDSDKKSILYTLKSVIRYIQVNFGAIEYNLHKK